MLSKFFKKQSIQDDALPIAKLSFVVSNDSELPVVDIELQDYSDASISALCDIIDILASERSLAETVEIIKNALVKDGQEEYLIKVFTRLGKHAKSKILESYGQKQYDEPCIIPSDAFANR